MQYLYYFLEWREVLYCIIVLYRKNSLHSLLKGGHRFRKGGFKRKSFLKCALNLFKRFMSKSIKMHFCQPVCRKTKQITILFKFTL